MEEYRFKERRGENRAWRRERDKAWTLMKRA